MMNSPLPDGIWSAQDLAELTQDLHRYVQWLSRYQVKQRVGGGTESLAAEPPRLAPAAVACLQALHQAQSLHQIGVEALIAELEMVQKNAPRISFTLAGPASNGLKKRLVAWSREHLGAETLVEFQFNATLLGGMVVRYGSHIFDWSWRRQILAKRDNFAEVVRHV